MTKPGRKTVDISKELWKKLMNLKTEYEYKKMEEIIQDVFDNVSIEEVLEEIKKRKESSEDEE